MGLISDRTGIADRFLMARRAAGGLAAFPGTFPATLDDAYAIQDEAIALWQKPVIGWKVGRIHPPLSERFGADRLAGPIFAARHVSDDGDVPEMPVFAQGFAAGEAEFLLRVGAAPPEGKKNFTLDEAADLIHAVHVGIEVASSPLGTINQLGPIAVISDFGNNNGMVVGEAVENWRESGFENMPVVTRIDGIETGSGSASAFPDGAIGAARFLLELTARRGIALAPGQWISSGAVTGVHVAYPGQLVEAEFGGLHRIACRLVAARPI